MEKVKLFHRHRGFVKFFIDLYRKMLLFWKQKLSCIRRLPFLKIIKNVYSVFSIPLTPVKQPSKQKDCSVVVANSAQLGG
jgi:hypothetical protein